MNSHDPKTHAEPHDSAGAEAVEMPESTIWPLILAVGVTLLAAGLATSMALTFVGVVLLVVSLAGWIWNLLPGRGHIHEPLLEPTHRPRPVIGVKGTVDHLRPGMIGYRFRLPENVHPISAGVKGGILGGAVMPIPALAYGYLSGHGIWFSINLLAGMVIPGMEDLSLAELEKFNLTWLLLGFVIHVVFSLGFGLMYGILLPTLPSFPGSPVVYGALMMPLIWSAMSYAFMGVVNPLLENYVEWRWFLMSQLVYGLAMSLVVIQQEKVPVAPAGTGTEAAFPEESNP